MDNSFYFFENNKCKYYPCHKGLDEMNCMFCYCPFYGWEECPGNNRYIEKENGKRIKGCIDCIFPHKPENYSKILEYLRMGAEEFYLTRHQIQCKLYGIGVGPGSPELITDQAKRIIRAVDILILPAKDKESCRAYTIAEKAIPTIKGKECVFVPFPMSMKEPELNEFHKQVALLVEGYLAKGLSVGFLTIGDVSIYSTFSYIDELVSADGYETEYICGITSFSAAAAALGESLALGSEEIHIIPGSADVDEALHLGGTLIFMKSGKRLVELKKKLTEKSMTEDIKAMAVSNCGMSNEVIARSIEDIAEDSGYLTVVIVWN